MGIAHLCHPQTPPTARPTGLIAAKVRAQRDLLDHAYFDSHCSRVNKALREALGSSMAQHYVIANEGCRPLSRYALGLEAEQIRVVG